MYRVWGSRLLWSGSPPSLVPQEDGNPTEIVVLFAGAPEGQNKRKTGTQTPPFKRLPLRRGPQASQGPLKGLQGPPKGPQDLSGTSRTF